MEGSVIFLIDFQRLPKIMTIAYQVRDAPGLRGKDANTVIPVWASVGVTLFVMAAMLALPVSLIGASTHDFVALLDGAYRIENGLVPHVDFPVEHGPLPLYQAWIALRLSSYTAPFYVVEASSFLLVLPPALYIALKQSDGARAAAVILAVAALTLLPFLILDNYLPGPAHLGIYNRASSATLYLIFIFSFTPKQVTWKNTLALTYLLVLLLGIKITTAMVGLVFCSLAAIVSTPSRILLLRALALILVLLFLTNFYHGIVVSYFHDILHLIGLNQGSLVGRALKQALNSAVPLVAGFAFALVAAYSLKLFPRPNLSVDRPIAQLRRLRPLLVIIVVLTATVVNESQNTGNIGAFAASSLAFYRFSILWNQKLILTTLAVLAATAVAPWSQTAVRGTAAALYHFRHVVTTPDISSLYPGAGAAEADMVSANDLGSVMKVWLQSTPSAQEALNVEFADRLGSAASFILLAQSVGKIVRVARTDHRISSESRVASLTEVQFFARILGTASGAQSNLWLDPTRTVNAADPNFARRYLQGVDVVFVPLCHFTPNERYLKDQMMPSVQEAFALGAETDCWQMWYRKR